MAYVIVVNPQILSQTGMPWGGVFLATIIAAIIGTLVMGLFANVPYAQAAGMGLNAFFTYTVCFGLGFTWQQTMCMVFLCGLINILITVTKIRKMIILAIPESLQRAIGGGIGLFVAYVGMLNVGLIKFTPGDPKAAARGGAVAATPGSGRLQRQGAVVFLIGLVLAIVFTVMKVKGGMLLAIVITTVIGIPFGVTTWSSSQSISETFSQLPQTFGAIFSAEASRRCSPMSPAASGHRDHLRLLHVRYVRHPGHFHRHRPPHRHLLRRGREGSGERPRLLLQDGQGPVRRLHRHLHRRHLRHLEHHHLRRVFRRHRRRRPNRPDSVVVAICFALSAFLAPVVSAVPSAATAGVLVIVGCMMAASLKEVKWDDIAEAIPAFFAAVFMAFSYSISYGIAGGFIMYCIVKTCKGKAKEVHPIIWTVAALFILDFVCMAIL